MMPLLIARASCASPGSDGTRAFSLVEIVLALGVITIALVALLGIVPTGLRINRESREEYQAQEILKQVLFERRQSLVLTNAASRFGFPANLATGAASQSLLSDQGRIVTNAAAARYELTYALYGTNVTGSSKPWLGVRVSWPVGASNSQIVSLGMPWSTP